MNSRILSDERLKDFEEFLIAEEKSKNTLEKYIRDVRAFKEYINKQTVTKDVVIEYKNKLVEKSYAIRSINSMIASINCFFVFMGWMDCRVKSIKVQSDLYCKEEKELTRNEYVRLVKTAQREGNERLCLILQTICSTGIRVSELQYITVEAVKDGRAKVFLKGKYRTVFIVDKLKRYLLKYANKKRISKGAIFVTKTGNVLCRSNIWREMKKLCAIAGVAQEKVFPHNLRHLFAKAFYEEKKDIAKLADVLGHSSINTTRIYIVSTGNEHRQCIEKLRLII